MKRTHVLLLFLAAAVIACSWKLHRTAGLGLPLPWADECLFVFPAINFADHNTLFTPQVNPERHLLWMPPGYSITLGIVLKIVPYSLAFVRDLSWLFTILLFVGLLYMMKDAAPPWIVVVLASMFLLATHFTVAGNTARMDAMLLCCVCWGWSLVFRGNIYRGIGVLLVSPLVHPYGTWYLVAACGYVVIRKRNTLRRPSFLEALPILIAAFLIAMYDVYVLQHPAEFIQDMQFQIERKVSRNIIERLFNDPMTRSLAIAYPIVLTAAVRFSRERIPTLVFGTISLLVQIIGLEMWYHLYVAVAALLLLVVIIGMSDEVIKQSKLVAIMQRGMLGLVVLLLLFWAHNRGFVLSPRKYPEKIGWMGMQMDPHNTYLTPSEQTRLVSHLNTLSEGHETTRIAFDPEGDALAVWSHKGCAFVPYYPLFTAVEPDVVVVHMTTFLPKWWKDHTQRTLTRWGIAEKDLLFVSDDGDRWYVKQVRRR
jgi:hypothetical protein